MQLFEFRCKTLDGKVEVRTEYLKSDTEAQSYAREIMLNEPFNLVKIRKASGTASSIKSH